MKIFIEISVTDIVQLALQDLMNTPSPMGKLIQELQASYQAYGILRMIIEWINNGLRYSFV